MASRRPDMCQLQRRRKSHLRMNMPLRRMTFVISSKPCSITRRLHCTCTQRCLRHCMLNGVESTRCHQLFCHHGCQLYKMPPWICCHAQATCPSALSLESGTARSRGHRDIERTSRETFCRCRTGLSTILPCRCHPRHSHPRHVGIRWCVDGLHGVTIY